MKNYNYFHNILRLCDVLPNFLPPQVKRCSIITYRHDIYELAHEFANYLRPRKVSKLHRMIAQCPAPP